MKILTCEQTRRLEQSQVDRGSAYYELMENAGVQTGKTLINNMGAVPGDSVAVLCGKGNNGGDGFVAARYLKTQGISSVILLVDGEPRTADAVRALNSASENHVPVLRIWERFEKVIEKIKTADFVIDAVYGIGFKGGLKNEIRELADIVNKSRSKVLCVDLPSGVNCDSGSVENGAFIADKTISFSTLKPAHVLYPSMDYCGETIVAQVGINKHLVSGSEYLTETIEQRHLENVLDKNKISANKGSVGTLFALCGSYGMAGAAVMSFNAALKSGTGLLKAAIPKSIYNIAASYITQAVFLPVAENQFGTVSKDIFPGIFDEIEKSSAVLLGCGMGLNEDTEYAVCEIIKNCGKPVIIDADGINAAAKHIDVLREKKGRLVLTPHPGEMARLLNCSVTDVQNNRIEAAKYFAEKFDVVLVLKGANTVVASPKGDVYINTTGNPGMAKGGSGDVLAGILGAFISRNADVFKSACAAVYCHGKAGDLAAQETGQLSVQPTDLTDRLPEVYKKVFKF